MAHFKVWFTTEEGEMAASVMALLQTFGLQPHIETLATGVAVETSLATGTQALSKRTPVNKQIAGQVDLTQVLSRSRNKEWAELIRLLGSEQKLLVFRMIKDAGDEGITASQGSARAGKDANWFTGVLNGGIQRNIRKAGFEIADVIAMRKTPAGWVYSPGPELKARSLPDMQPNKP